MEVKLVLFWKIPCIFETLETSNTLFASATVADAKLVSFLNISCIVVTFEVFFTIERSIDFKLGSFSNSPDMSVVLLKMILSKPETSCKLGKFEK